MRASVMRRGGGTGRRAGFKIRFLHGSVGSIPTLGTIGQSRAGNKKEQLTLLFFISQTVTLTFLYEYPSVDKP